MPQNRKRLLTEAVVQGSSQDVLERRGSVVDPLLTYDFILSWLIQKPPQERVGIACLRLSEEDVRHCFNVLGMMLYEHLDVQVYVKVSGWHLPRKAPGEMSDLHAIPWFCSCFLQELASMAAGSEDGQVDVTREVAVEMLRRVKDVAGANETPERKKDLPLH